MRLSEVHSARVEAVIRAALKREIVNVRCPECDKDVDPSHAGKFTIAKELDPYELSRLILHGIQKLDAEINPQSPQHDRQDDSAAR